MKGTHRLNPVAQVIRVQRRQTGATLAAVSLSMGMSLGNAWAQTADAPAAAVPVAANESAPVQPEASVTVLPKVVVEARAPSEYRGERLSSPKFTEPLRDTPQTVQVITSELFNMQGATNLTEALRNSPAVGTFYVGENGTTNTGDAITMRGFDTSSSIFVDGVRDVGSVSRDIFNIDSVEVTKGPAGTDSGRGAPTGSINMVSKQAALENGVGGTISAGNYNQKRLTGDLNQTLNALPGAAMRLNVMWQDSDVPGRDVVNNSRSGIAPALAFGLDGKTRAYVNLLYIKQDNVPDGGVPTIGLPGWTPQTATNPAPTPPATATDLTPLTGHRVDSRNFYGTRLDHDDSTSEMATVRIEHDFSDGLKLSDITRWGQTTQDYVLTTLMGTNTNIKTTNPGDPNDLSAYTLVRTPTYKDQQNKILTNQLNLRYDFATGFVRHSLSTGFELTREQQYSYGRSANGTRPVANLYDPNPKDVDPAGGYRNNADSFGRTTTVALYAFDTLKFGEHFLVTGGLRADRYDTRFESAAICTTTVPLPRNGYACPTGVANGTVVQKPDMTSKDTLINWKIGAVYKPVEDGSIYANYAISQQPPGGANFTLSTSATSADNPNLEPQKAKTYELGTKWDVIHEALSVNLALFRTEVSNEIDTTTTPPTQEGQKRVQGVELSAVGSITKNWAVSAGYTHQDTKVQTGAIALQDGTDGLAYTPKDAFTAWTTYHLPMGFTVGGGARYSGKLHRGTDGAVGTPSYAQSYTVYDAMAEYMVNKHFTLRANAYNLFDKDYVAGINKSGYRYTPGAPRSFLFSGDFRF